MLFPQGSAMLDKMFESEAVPVTYRRGDTVVATNIPAKLGAAIFRQDSARSGLTVIVRRHDFIVRETDLNGIEPKPQDVIECQDGTEYVVGAPGGEPCWRPHSRHGTRTIRIHASER